MRRWRRWGSIAMAGGWLHTVHSAHGQMEQFFCSDVSKMINKQWKHSEHRPGISTSNCLGWTRSFTLRIGYYTINHKQKVLKQLPLVNHQLSYTHQILFISLRLHTIDGSQYKANTSIPASSLAVRLTDASPGRHSEISQRKADSTF